MMERPLILNVVGRALEGADGLPAWERADLYEGIALLLDGHLIDLAEEAKETARVLREAETRQLTFAALLRPNPTQPEPQKTRRHE